MAKIHKPPLKKAMVGKSALKTTEKKQIVSPRVGSLEVESPPLCSTPLTVSSRLSTEFLSTLFPSSMSAVSKSSSVPSTISNVNKRLVLNDVDHRAKTKPKNQEPKLAAYDIDWFDLSAIKNECLKYTHITNLPDTQEGQITFLLSKFEMSIIKTAFADAIGKVDKAAITVFYPLPPCKEKLIKGFLELISGKNSIMVDHLKDSFR
jgi:hypothetical protein